MDNYIGSLTPGSGGGGGGFDPSSMPTVTETPSLLQAQADWNQSNASAADYIKNKPTIPTSNDVYEVSDLGLWVGSNTTHLTGRLYRNGVPVSNETFWFMGSYSDDSLLYSGSSGSETTENTGSFTYDIGNGSIGNNYNIKYFNVKVYNNSNQEKLLISYTYTRVKAASSIAASEAGYATGDQVYQVVGNINTLLAQI